MVALAYGARTHAAGIGAGVRLGLGEGDCDLAAQRREEEALLLLVVAEVKDRADGGAEQVVVAERQRLGAGDLLLHDAAGKHAEAQAAVLLGHVELPEPERLHLLLQRLEHRLVQLLVEIDLHLDGDQLLVHELAKQALHHLDVAR